eukprot:jgi/Botrbrau1/18002/Bobra.0407s0002.1
MLCWRCTDKEVADPIQQSLLSEGSKLVPQEVNVSTQTLRKLIFQLSFKEAMESIQRCLRSRGPTVPGSPNWTNLQEPNYLFTIRGGGDRRLVNTHTENMAPHLNAVQRRELAVEKARQNQYEEALQYLNAADTLQPNDAVTLRYRGEILRVLCRFDEALQDLSQAVDLETKDAYARWSRGDTLSRLGRYNEALSDLNQAVILDPNDARARCSRGETLRVLRRFDKALQDLNMAVNQEPNHAPARARKL